DGQQLKSRGGAAQAELLNVRARSLEEIGDYSAALGLREAALLLDPDNFDARLMALTHWRRQQIRHIPPQVRRSRDYPARRDEAFARNMDVWGHQHRHISELMTRKLVNPREAVLLHQSGMDVLIWMRTEQSARVAKVEDLTRGPDPFLPREI